MNRIVIINLILFSFCCHEYGQEYSDPGIAFDTLIHDFGTLNKGSDASCNFSFENRSENPMVITSVNSSCGCAVTEWTREPVMPGASGNVSVKYNTRITGTFHKTITIHHSQNSRPVVLTIQGTVIKPRKKQ